jgi:hypothetical protein
MTENLQQEERTDRPAFNVFRNEKGQLYLRIFAKDGRMHVMIECDEDDIARLRERLTRPPLPIDSSNYE